MLAQITDALRRGDAAAALAAARTFAADEPGNAVAHHLLGVSRQRTGDTAGARDAFERAIELAPDRAETHFALATLVLAEGDTPAAIRRLHETLSLDPNQLGGYLLLGQLALARGDVEEAERNLKLAQRVDADQPQVVLLEGHVRQFKGEPDAALNCFSEAVRVAPRLPAAQLALGTAYLARGNWAFAEQAFANALALAPKRAPSTLRALIEARRRQGKRDETLQSLSELIAQVPDDLYARALRTDILLESDPAAALPDLEEILKLRPTHAPTLLTATALMVNAGRSADALDRMEAALAANPGDDMLWRVRLNLSGRLAEDAKTILDRWEAVRPDTVELLDLLAGYHQTRGDHALAATYAARALAQRPDAPISNSVMLREELAADPAVALARADRLLADLADPAARRTLLGWAGMALDALGRHDEAAVRFREMVATPVPGAYLVPPPPMRADAAPAGDAAGTLLVMPPGVRAEVLLQTMKPMLGANLRLDRLQFPQSVDGFGSRRVQAGHPEAGSAQRWREALASQGLDPAHVVDVLTTFDGYTLEALRGARVVALTVDPRDALLNWMVHGSVQNFLFSNIVESSARWLATVLEMLVAHGDAHAGAVHIVRLDTDAAAAQLGSLLDLPSPLPATAGAGTQFPAGHWRRYRDAFAKEFALLTPVAQRLGYAAD